MTPKQTKWTPEDVDSALQFARELGTDKHSDTFKRMMRDVSVLAAEVNRLRNAMSGIEDPADLRALASYHHTHEIHEGNCRTCYLAEAKAAGLKTQVDNLNAMMGRSEKDRSAMAVYIEEITAKAAGLEKENAQLKAGLIESGEACYAHMQCLRADKLESALAAKTTEARDYREALEKIQAMADDEDFVEEARAILAKYGDKK